MNLPFSNNKDTMKCIDIVNFFYDGKKANRSKVPYINHIIEGIAVIKARNFFNEEDIIGGYALHPLVQQDDDLKRNLPVLHRFGVSPMLIALATEYRNLANAYLSHRKIESIYDIDLSPLSEVNEMLVADKVQNKKDFDLYHKGSHPRSDELEEYFNNWLERLNITDKMYKEYVKIMAKL